MKEYGHIGRYTLSVKDSIQIYQIKPVVNVVTGIIPLHHIEIDFEGL